MGIVQSIFCSITFCVERVLTWTCCAFLLMLLMFTLVLLMVYGISVGYHYAQKELSTFAMASRPTSEATLIARRSGDEEYQPVVRLLAVNQTEAQSPRKPLLGVKIHIKKQLSFHWKLISFLAELLTKTRRLAAAGTGFGTGSCASSAMKVFTGKRPNHEVYRTDRPSENVYLENTPTPIIMLETERPPREPELSPHEKEFAKRLIGRIRRSKNNTETKTEQPFLRPLRSSG